jgi:hypothetical protein
MDERRRLIKERLYYLGNGQLRRILYMHSMLCTDEFNFNPEKGTYCPVALALNAPNMVKQPTDEKVKKFISGYFQEVNILKGVPGEFYHGTHEERKKDILDLVREILEERRQAQLIHGDDNI